MINYLFGPIRMGLIIGPYCSVERRTVLISEAGLKLRQSATQKWGALAVAAGINISIWIENILACLEIKEVLSVATVHNLGFSFSH